MSGYPTEAVSQARFAHDTILYIIFLSFHALKYEVNKEKYSLSTEVGGIKLDAL